MKVNRELENDNEEEMNQKFASETFTEFFGKAEEMIKRHNHCVICQARLHFTHLTDFHRNLTEESARCPECGNKARRILHRLQ
ncbi:MAG: hypothetical protein JNL01_07545 [Bdellovibrionales bacterium]|nr:hypothetical protein [Bdellovibrionales bacterium]